jgi:anti-sigma factor RsiW
MKTQDQDEPKIEPTCPWQINVPEYIVGELSEKDAENFRKHLADCPVCRKELSEAEYIVDQIRNIQYEESPNGMTERVLAEIPESEWQESDTLAPQHKRLRLGLLKWAACIAVAALGGWLIFSSLRSDDQPSRIAGEEENEAARKSQAISQALQWLAEAQQADGGWDAQQWGGMRGNSVGVTALALLSFLADNNREVHADYASTIQRASDFLIRQQRFNGRFGPPSANAMYNHGIATVALLEMARKTRTTDHELQRTLKRGIEFIRKTQTSSGGWSSLEGLERGESVPVSVWQLRGLALAKELGIREVDQNLRLGMAWMEKAKREIKHAQGWNLQPQASLLRNQIRSGPYKGSWPPEDRWSLAGGRVYSTARAALSLKDGIPSGNIPTGM